MIPILWLNRSHLQHRSLSLVLAITIGLLFPLGAAARHTIAMYVGEVRVLAMGEIERVAIGNPKVASNTILPEGQLVLLADAEGVTTMHIWLKNGQEKEFDVTVKPKQALDNHRELVRLLADMPGVSVQRVGNLSVLRGNISLQDKLQYDRIVSRYQDVLDLVTAHDTAADVTALLENVPGITVRESGGFSVISGEVSSEYAHIIKIIETKFANVLNMTRVHEAVAGKMVYMKVRIMEMKRTLTENLGINWNVLEGIPGPSFEFGVERTANGATILNNSQQDAVPQSLAQSGLTNLTSPTGYFGIATGVGSIINLYEGTGDAVVLAEPRLSTRSGGTAEFLAGGEFPVPVTNSLGSTDVEFKKYGISLNVAPEVDDQGNILAHVETEISTIDKANAVNGIPGVLTRRSYTDVSLRAEQTLVIAGLVEELASKDYSNVKWLNEIPVLGELFKSKDFQNQQTELVIFITPSIYDASSALNTAALKKGEEIDNQFDRIIKGEKLLE
jgi:pilus assembly protein CpaC